MSSWLFAETMLLSPYDLIIVMILPLFVLLALWLVMNRKKLGDKFRKRFRRGWAVKVRQHLTAKNVIERVVVPNDRGFFELDDALYQYRQEVAEWDEEDKLWCVDIYVGQTSPGVPHVVTIPNETFKLTDEGKIIKMDDTEKSKGVPTWVAVHHTVGRALINQKTAEDNLEAVKSKVVQDIVTSTANEFALLKPAVYLLGAIGVVMLVGFAVVYYKTTEAAAAASLAATIAANANHIAAAGHA